MTDIATTAPDHTVNPLDLLEEVALANEWLYDRPADDELSMLLPGNWSDYRIGFIWQPDFGGLQCYAKLDLTVPASAESELALLLMQVNERLCLGHFIHDSVDRHPLFRYTLMLRGQQGGMALEQVEDIIETMMGECERFWPAFSFLIRDGRPARAAMAEAILETHGEA